MTIRMRKYTGLADLQPIIELKRLCTTPQNIYDAPTVSDLRELLTPTPQSPTATRPAWEDEQGKVIKHLYQRAMTGRQQHCRRKQMAHSSPMPLLPSPKRSLPSRSIPRQEAAASKNRSLSQIPQFQRRALM